MQEIPTKSTGDQLTASEFNNIPDELENAIQSTDITLSGGDRFQLSKAVSDYSASGAFYTDGGSADTYVLSPIANKKGITKYFSGTRVSCIAANTNTGASTVNVNGLGVKNIVDINGNALIANEILAGRIIELVYNRTVVVLYNDGISSGKNSRYAPGFVGKEAFLTNVSSPDVQHDIVFGKGAARGINNLANLDLVAGLIKKIDSSWALGNNQGGFPTGITLSANTWYHLFVIGKLDGTTDAGFDTNLDANKLLADATGFVDYLHLSSIKTDGSSNIILHNQEFVGSVRRTLWDMSGISTSLVDKSGVGPTTDTVGLNVPPGVNVKAFGEITYEGNAAGDQASIFNTDHAALGALSQMLLISGSGAPYYQSSYFELYTKKAASAKIYQSGGATSKVRYTTRGWTK
jgi:hypothetical protein